MRAKGHPTVSWRLVSFAAVFLSVLLLGPASCKKKAPAPQAKAGAETAVAVEKVKPAEKAKVEEKVRIPEKAKPRERQPSSLDLVEKAAQDGTLDLDTAWIYRFQAMFEPEALPEQYRGRGRIPCGTPVFAEFRGVRDKLASETLTKLKPYLVRPTDPVSVFAKRVGKLKQEKERQQSASAPDLPGSGLLFAGEQQQPGRPDKDTSGINLFCPVTQGNIKVWAPLDCTFAEVIAFRIAFYRMWERFAELMARTPLSDGAERDNGGDGLLDIYLVPKSPWTEDSEDPGSFVLGYCVPTQGGQTSPAYLIIEGTQAGAGIEATIAHEMFHAFQFAFDVDEEAWWMEGTAVWAENFIDPGWDTEHDYDEDAFDKARHLLLPVVSEEGLHEYGIYLFPFYLAKVYADWIVRLIWEECPAMTVTKAVRKVMDETAKDGFKGVFKTFAYMNWAQNQDPKGVKYPEEVRPEEYHDYEYHVDLPLPAPFAKSEALPTLSAIYYVFWNTSQKEENFPHLTFDLKDFAGAPDLSVQAFVQYRNKEPAYEDWTGRAEVEFCLNDPEQDFEWVALTLGNSASLLGMTPQLRVWQSSSGCGEGESTATLTVTEHYKLDSVSNESGGRSERSVEQQLEATISMVLDYDRSTYSRADKRIKERWKVRDWKITAGQGWIKDLSHWESSRGWRTEKLDTAAPLAVKRWPDRNPGEVAIVIDETTGKATEVHFGIYTVQIDWRGISLYDSVIEGRTSHRETPVSGEWYLRLENISSKEVGQRYVTGGDGVRTLSGGGKQVWDPLTTGSGKTVTTTTCRWSVNRVVKPASKK